MVKFEMAADKGNECGGSECELVAKDEFFYRKNVNELCIRRTEGGRGGLIFCAY